MDYYLKKYGPPKDKFEAEEDAPKHLHKRSVTKKEDGLPVQMN